VDVKEKTHSNRNVLSTLCHFVFAPFFYWLGNKQTHCRQESKWQGSRGHVRAESD
jgi:hypothetical protein